MKKGGKTLNTTKVNNSKNEREKQIQKVEKMTGNNERNNNNNKTATGMALTLSVLALASAKLL